MRKNKMKPKKIAILGAMPQEVEAYQNLVIDGKWNDKEVYVGVTGVGKAAAAASTQKVISEFQPDAIIFTGVAGALDPTLEIGDLCIGVAAIDADLDVRTWDSSYQKGEMPFTRERVYRSDSDLVGLAHQAAYQSEIGRKLIDAYIATGSKFLDQTGKEKFVSNGIADLTAEVNGNDQIPNIYEMEGSAVLQVANANNVPCLAIRTISDTLHGDAPKDFNKFVEKAVDDYVAIVDYVLENV